MIAPDLRDIPLRNGEEDLIDERRALKGPQGMDEHGDTGQREVLFRNVALPSSCPLPRRG